MGNIVIEIFGVNQSAISENHAYLRFEHGLVKETGQPAGLTVFNRFQNSSCLVQGRSIVFNRVDHDPFCFGRRHLSVTDTRPSRKGDIHDRFHVTWPDAAHVNQAGVEKILVQCFFHRFAHFQRASRASARSHAEIYHRNAAVIQFLPFFSGGLLQCGKIRHTPPEFSSGVNW